MNLNSNFKYQLEFLESEEEFSNKNEEEILITAFPQLYMFTKFDLIQNFKQIIQKNYINIIDK